MRNLDRMPAGEAAAMIRVATLSWFAHRHSGALSEALWTKRLLRFCFLIPEWSPKLEIIAFETQPLSKFAVLIFEF